MGDRLEGLIDWFPAPRLVATGAAVLVFPGGGYRIRMDEREGTAVARWFNVIGVSAGVVNYRLGSDGHRHPAQLDDARRAMRILREGAGTLGIAPDRIGVIGFSAGGHLAALLMTALDKGDGMESAEACGVSPRPDFGILVYPVISMCGDDVHEGTRTQLLGMDPDSARCAAVSCERNVDDRTPPAFIVHTTEDELVSPLHSLAFYRALHEHGVPCELHVFEQGRHGLDLGVGVPGFGAWRGLAHVWMKQHGFV